jgi:hypothetical protein
MLLFVINEGLDGFRFRPLSPRYLHIALHQGHAEKDYETGGNSKLFVPEKKLTMTCGDDLKMQGQKSA